MADGESVENNEKELTAKQRKNRKKREAVKRKKQEGRQKVFLVYFLVKFKGIILNKSVLNLCINIQDSEKVREETLANDEEYSQEATEVTTSALFTFNSFFIISLSIFLFGFGFFLPTFFFFLFHEYL